MGRIISVKHKGNFRHFERFTHRVLKQEYMNILRAYADMGVKALKEATPTESGDTADAWGYEIESGDGITTLTFTNSHEENGLNIAILLIYGHGTRNGGYVQGNDFVSPALRPIFQDLADAIWKEVTK